MTQYKNLGGRSGVYSYEIGGDSIEVQFNDGMVYLYTENSAGSTNLEQMKKLALAGSGLNSFINKYVKKGYESKRG